MFMELFYFIFRIAYGAHFKILNLLTNWFLHLSNSCYACGKRVDLRFNLYDLILFKFFHNKWQVAK